MVKNADISNPRRLLDDPVTVTNENGDPVQVSLSDHFAVQSTLTWSNECDWAQNSEYKSLWNRLKI